MARDCHEFRYKKDRQKLSSFCLDTDRGGNGLKEEKYTALDQ